MKKNALLLFILCSVFFFKTIVLGQLSYNFSRVTSVAYANLTSPTQAFGPDRDLIEEITVALPFTFYYACTTYSQIQICSNGFANLDLSETDGGTEYLNSPFGRNCIAPLWDDLATCNNGQGGAINYATVGTAPNRVFVVEWKNMKWNYNSAGAQPVISFQMKLYEGSNLIEFHYLDGSRPVNTGSAAIGLSGPTANEYFSVNSAGTAASSTVHDGNISVKPTNGVIYRFTPKNHCSGIPNAGIASTTLQPTCNSQNYTASIPGVDSCGISYQWQTSSDNISFANVSGATAKTYSSTTGVDLYMRCIASCVFSSKKDTTSSTLITFGGLQNANDFPCNAIQLTLNQDVLGTNSCSYNASEPAAPTCWTTGNVNSVWYKATVPASGKLSVKTVLLSYSGSLTSTQIALYSGSCTSLTELGCNQAAPDCSGSANLNSEVALIGRTAGETIYIRVDGRNALKGDFRIIAFDGNTIATPTTGRDCQKPFKVCSPSTKVGNTGFNGNGSNCDFSGTCLAGERNSVWFEIKIGSSVSLPYNNKLEFEIVPNNISALVPEDYDFALFKMSGTGATTCDLIRTNPVTSACSYALFPGRTGCTSSGNSTNLLDSDLSYESSPTVAPNDRYYLVVSSASTTIYGFELKIISTITGTSSPVVYNDADTVFWSGGNNSTLPANADNWGGCNLPSCSVSAIVSPSATSQPSYTSGTHNVNNLLVEVGSTLTLQPNAVLQICGNFENKGSIVCDATSIIRFVGTGTQTLSGDLTGVNALGNIEITKTSGVVVLGSDVDLKGGFTATSATSSFNHNGKIMKLNGNFTNNATSYLTNGTTDHLQFVGTTNQTYNQGATAINQTLVTVNKNSGNLVLGSDLNLATSGGILNLTKGKIETGNFAVTVKNPATTAIVGGTQTSYVFGNLNRALLGTPATYNFPIGTSTLLQHTKIQFTTNTTIPQLNTRFNAWTSGPNTLNKTECEANYINPSMNNGFWTVNATSNPTSGTYNMTLYPKGVTNKSGFHWTVEKAVAEAGPWVLSGSCTSSGADSVVRNNMNGFSVFAIAQSSTPLPVEIISFFGKKNGDFNDLFWEVGAEINLKQYEVLKSTNGTDFDLLYTEREIGNSTYTLTDKEQTEGIAYYQLIGVDYDGKLTKSEIVALAAENSNKFNVLSVYPNPSKGEFKVQYQNPDAEEIHWSLQDAQARPILVGTNDSGEAGFFSIDISHLKPGVYWLNVGPENRSRVTKKLIRF